MNYGTKGITVLQGLRFGGTEIPHKAEHVAAYIYRAYRSFQTIIPTSIFEALNEKISL